MCVCVRVCVRAYMRVHVCVPAAGLGREVFLSHRLADATVLQGEVLLDVDKGETREHSFPSCCLTAQLGALPG